MSSALDITRAVNPPRAAFLDYPLGHTTGKPHEPALQREILSQALEALTTLQIPGSVKMLPFTWSADQAWQATAQRGPPTDIMLDRWSAYPKSYAFPTTVTNPLSQSTIVKYDYYLGKPTSVTDSNTQTT